MRKYTHLSSEERTFIAHDHNQDMPISQMARALGRSKASIFRELKRNRNQGGYTTPTRPGVGIYKDVSVLACWIRTLIYKDM